MIGVLPHAPDQPHDALLRLVADPNSPPCPYIVVVHDAATDQACYLGPHPDHATALRNAELIEELDATLDVSIAPLFASSASH